MLTIGVLAAEHIAVGLVNHHQLVGSLRVFPPADSDSDFLIELPNDEIARRSVVTGLFNIKLTDKFTVGPSFIYQTMSGADEISLQALGAYQFNAEKDIDLNFGLGYRLSGGDAIYPMLGARYKNLRVGLAYDVNISSLNSVSNYRGGFELAANYIVKIYKLKYIMCIR